jgi:hypothetical protein
LNPLGLFLEPLGLFLHTSIPFIWRILSAFLPARTPWLRGPVSPRWSWNAAAAVFAYGYGTLAELQYKYVGQDQLIGGTWPDNEPAVGLGFGRGVALRYCSSTLFPDLLR